MRNRFISIAIDIRKVFFQYPLVLICSFIMMIAAQGLVDATDNETFILTKVLLISGLGISLFFGLAMLGQRKGRKWLWNMIGIIFLILFYFLLLPDEQRLFTERYVYLLVPSFILSHLLVAIAPFLSKRHDEQSFWQFNKTLFVNIFLSLVFTAVLSGGILLALLAMEHLFILGWHSDVYIRVLLSILIFGSTLIFCLFHIGGLEKMEAPDSYPIVIQFFTQYILIPLLFIYLSILYIYSIKILWTWQLPRGWVSYLVLAYGALGILALLLVHPLLAGGSRAWVSWFRKLFYYSLLPLLVLLFTAVGTRIGQYGFTEARHFVLVLAIWLCFLSFYFILSKKPKLKAIPITLFLIGVGALSIPYLNTFSVSIRSQKQAIKKLLQENNLLENGKIALTRSISNQVLNELQDKYIYLEQRDQQTYIWAMLDSEKVTILEKSPWSFRNLFTKVTVDDDDTSLVSVVIKSLSETYKIEDYSYLIKIGHQNNIQFSLGDDSLAITKILYGESRQFALTINGSIIDLLPLIEAWETSHIDSQITQSVDEISIPFDHGAYQGLIFLDQLNIDNRNQSNTYFFTDALFVFRKKNILPK